MPIPISPLLRCRWKTRRLAALLFLSLLLLAAGCGRRRRSPAPPPPVGHVETGIASWYGHPYHGRRAANGEIYDMEKLTAAHRTFAFGTWVRVLNLDNRKSIDVRITDRGPFVRGRIIDLSRAAARQIDMIGPGLAKVRLEIIRAPASPPSRAASRTAEPDPPSAPESFAVQVGAFQDRRNAELHRRNMERQFGSARLVLRDAAPPLWRVLVGELPSFDQAEELAARIRTAGLDGFTVRLDR